MTPDYDFKNYDIIRALATMDEKTAIEYVDFKEKLIDLNPEKAPDAGCKNGACEL